MAEAFLDRKRKGGPDGSVATELLDPDVLRVGNLPADVVIGESWDYAGATYKGESRTAFELHLEANGGAWQQQPGDRRFYQFANRVYYAGGKVIVQLKLPAQPGAITNGRVNSTPLAFALASSTWTGTPGNYQLEANLGNNPIPTIGEFVVAFTTTNAQAVWYPQGYVSSNEDFSAKDAHILSAFDTEGYTDIANAIDQGGFFNASVPDLSQLSGRQYGNTFSWSGSSTTETYYKGFRVPVARKSEIRSFHAKVGNETVTTLTVLGDLAGYTYGYITLHGYVANSVISLQALGKVSIDTDRLDVSDWNEALGFYASGTVANLPANAPAGSRAIVYANGTTGNGIWWKFNAGWKQVAPGPWLYASKALLDAASADDGTAAVVTGAGERAFYLRLAGNWVLIANVTAAAQPGAPGTSIAAVFAALAATDPAGVINIARIPKLSYSQLPDNLAFLDKAVRRGGERDYPGDDVQIGAIVRQAAFANLPVNYGFKAGTGDFLQVAVRDNALGGVVANNVHVLIRFSKTTYPDRPSIDDVPKLQLRLGYEPESPVIRPALTAVNVVDANYWYADALIPQLPADSDVYMELNEPPIIDAGLEDGIITPSMLALEGDPVEGGYYSYHDGQFQMRRAAGWQLLYRGSQGITVTNLQANNGLQRIEYDGPFNLGTAHDGYYLYEVTMEWVAGHDPATLAFDTDGGSSVQASGQVALFQAKAEAVYDGVNNLGAVGLRIPAYAGAGSDTHIGDVVWRSDRAQDNDGASNVRFEGIAGTGISGSGGSISARVEIWYISSGAGSAGAHIPNSISTLFGFDDALPLATSYQVGTAALVDEGASRGVWRNEDEVIPGAGLGLAGKTFDYQYDATQVVHGDRTWHILARAAFTLADYPGVNFAAYGDLSDYPAEMEFIAFGYLTQSRSDGYVYIGFNADQSATNNVQFETGGTGVAIVRQTNRLWRSASISAANVGHIRQGVWNLTEPNATGARHTQRWRKIAGIGRRESLVDWTPAAPLNCPQNSLVQLPAAAALSRDLTEDDDDKELEITVWITSDTGSNIPPRLANAIVVPAGQWREMAAAAVGNGFHQAPQSYYMSMGTNNTAGNVGQVLAAVSKGPDGRLGFISIFSNRANRCRLLKVQMDLLG